MKKSRSLETLDKVLMLKKRALDKKAELLRRQQAILQEAQEKYALLQEHHDEACKACDAQGQKGLSMSSWTRQRQFIHTLHTACLSSQKHVEKMQQSLVDIQTRYAQERHAFEKFEEHVHEKKKQWQKFCDKKQDLALTDTYAARLLSHPPT